MTFYMLDDILEEKTSHTTQYVEFIADGDKDHIFYLSGNSLGDLVNNIEGIKRVVPSHRIFENSEDTNYLEKLSEDASPVYIESVRDFKNIYLT